MPGDHEMTAGGYAFAEGIHPYSSGVRAGVGHEIVHATLQRPMPWRAGFDLVAEHLGALGRPLAALCSVALRSPAPYTLDGFGEFNTGYRSVLEDWGLIVEGRNPVARTNVAPVVGPPAEASLYTFGYTVPAVAPSGTERPTFVVSGAGDLVDQADLRGGAVIGPGDHSDESWRARIGQVMDQMASRMERLGVGWSDVTVIDVYSAGPLRPFIEASILEAAGDAAVHGVHWYLSHPPVRGLSFEMDVRGVRTELRL